MSKLPKCFVDEFENLPAEVDRLIYVRDETRKKIGVILINDGSCGWSLWDEKEPWDTFSGILTAWERLVEGKKIFERREEILKLNDSYCGDKSFLELKTGILLQELRKKDPLHNANNN